MLPIRRSTSKDEVRSPTFNKSWASHVISGCGFPPALHAMLPVGRGSLGTRPFICHIHPHSDLAAINLDLRGTHLKTVSRIESLMLMTIKTFHYNAFQSRGSMLEDGEWVQKWVAGTSVTFCVGEMTAMKIIQIQVHKPLACFGFHTCQVQSQI